MKLENVLDAFNSLTNSKLLIIRRSKSVSKFTKCLKEQSITIIDYTTNNEVYTAKDVDSINLTDRLEKDVLNFILKLALLKDSNV